MNTLMNTRHRSLSCLITTTAVACALVVSGCAKKEPAPAAPATPAAAPQPAAPAAPATPTVAAPAPTPAPVAAPKADPLKSMVSSATKAAETTAAQLQSTPVPTAPAAPTVATTPTPAVTPAPAVTPTPAAPASIASGLTALQSGTKTTGESTVASLAASAGDIQKQAEELLTRYSGELATLKSGAAAVKTYVDQHPEILPEAAKAKYQQLTSMVPQLESLVGTLKDYKSADLTTLVPKLQNDFAKAKSLYSEVRALLPQTL